MMCTISKHFDLIYFNKIVNFIKSYFCGYCQNSQVYYDSDKSKYFSIYAYKTAFLSRVHMPMYPHRGTKQQTLGSASKQQLH